jgi:hypothetical protein
MNSTMKESFHLLKAWKNSVILTIALVTEEKYSVVEKQKN